MSNWTIWLFDEECNLLPKGAHSMSELGVTMAFRDSGAAIGVVLCNGVPIYSMRKQETTEATK